MNQEFLDFYNRELRLFTEHTKEFAEEYPGIAERLGGLVGERMDPMVGGLLEGAAFLAARVQLKLKHEFPEFTNNLLEQLIPNYLAPTPSALLAGIAPTYGDPALREGVEVPRGSYLDATYVERDRRVACRYRLSSPVTIWPFEVASAEYIAAPGRLQALGLPADGRVLSGLRLSLTHRIASDPAEEPSPEQASKLPNSWFAGCKTRDLTVHLLGTEADAIALYEQIFADRLGLYFRYLDEFGDPVVLSGAECGLEQIGFDEDEALLPADTRVFRGFDLLREQFWFPRKFLGFKLTGLDKVMSRLKAKTVDIIFVFDEVNTRLPAAVQRELFALYAAPAVNLFEKTTDRIPVRRNEHEYHVVPDRSRMLDYEPHSILDVYAHYSGGRDKQPVHPLYSSPEGASPTHGLLYTQRRLPRRRSSAERREGRASDYTGTEMFISLYEPATVSDAAAVAELSIRALCSNRHLTEHLPTGVGGADFRLIDNVVLDVTSLAGPTPPREPIVSQLRLRSETASTGVVTWRLINLLSLNHLGLVQRGAGENAEALREMLSLFADLADSATERRIRGIKSVDSRPVIRRFPQRAGTGAARGLEITVLFDEKAFEGSGVFLLGAILDRFFAEYAAMNHFTQTVIRTVERGEVMRFPPRAGTRRIL
ncbi:Type VI secretion system protein ImpG [Bosea sp. 62]|uniref:type VI secretion system baseplate subunit TssF n=1 Tax=unclassified Bosea (in: a-proteobacteria) TaxID=2653178 RepID=UPI001259E8EC|nr:MULTISPECIES: type VI secretion system baseplate subunit TssF [unclassified Bosea (in: a-proteobacteria)]CAD5257907.1 Type VI secretion system protein ImpG [Bosea sp. 46]CAD5262341.1 Type VI secretion system protein ImpG [Bosea sp. 21B]CAD5278127.1 Type VI secretion system protein ImpG [Bosea sp. 7B]VVT58703.1 Type VI secretion system protein ImpG [Bosea sp. EC-HK365B]VXB58953.1 Type VI secretion system protein ImpG [Bosea sp. 29B]